MTQNEIVLEVLHHHPLTPLEALRGYGIMRLGARVWDLRHEGFKIKSRKIKVRTRTGHTWVTEYYMEARP